MQTRLRTISDISQKECKDYAIYTVESRAIPSMIDGLKPVQRFGLYSAIQSAPTSLVKVASISGDVSKYGYHHGEASAAAAIQLMAADWCNNYPLLQHEGNFGSRLVKRAAAPRYTFCKLHDNFNKLFKDSDIAPKHDDDEHIPPRYYLPLLPTVLINGISGVATGFATKIFSFNLIDIKSVVIEYLKSDKVKKNTDINIQIPNFTGTITRYTNESIYIDGSYEIKGLMLSINEVPIQYDRVKYIELLEKLIDEKIISTYTDQCGESGFKFDIRMKQEFVKSLPEDSEEKHLLILKTFGLRESMTQNLIVIDENQKLRNYNTTYTLNKAYKTNDIIFNKHETYLVKCDFIASNFETDLKNNLIYLHNSTIQLIIDFVNFRLKFYDIRIAKIISELNDNISRIQATIDFINLVINNKINFKELDKKGIANLIKEKYNDLFKYIDYLLDIKLYNLSKDNQIKLSKQLDDKKKELDYYMNTTSSSEYLKDLNNIKL